MTQTLFSVGLFLLVLAMVPVGIKWLQRRSATRGATPHSASKIVSVLALGPHQRVVTVEVGPADARMSLVLGVTAHSITCLHSAVLQGRPNGDETSVLPAAPSLP